MMAADNMVAMRDMAEFLPNMRHAISGYASKNRYRALEKAFNAPYQLTIIAAQPGMDICRRKTFLTKPNADQIPG
jgi:hypothetical protein